MVLKCPNIMELGADRAGFFGGSFQFTKGGSPEENTWAAGEDTESLAGCKGQMVKVQDPGGTACDQTQGQVPEQRVGTVHVGTITANRVNHWMTATRQGTVAAK